MSYSIVFTDNGPSMDLALVANGAAFPLEEDDVVVLRYTDPAGSTHEVELEVDDAAGGLVHRTWDAVVDLPVVGWYQGQVEVRRPLDETFPRTLPNDGKFVIWPVNRKI